MIAAVEGGQVIGERYLHNELAGAFEDSDLINAPTREVGSTQFTRSANAKNRVSVSCWDRANQVVGHVEFDTSSSWYAAHGAALERDNVAICGALMMSRGPSASENDLNAFIQSRSGDPNNGEAVTYNPNRLLFGVNVLKKAIWIIAGPDKWSFTAYSKNEIPQVNSVQETAARLAWTLPLSIQYPQFLLDHHRNGPLFPTECTNKGTLAGLRVMSIKGKGENLCASALAYIKSNHALASLLL